MAGSSSVRVLGRAGTLASPLRDVAPPTGAERVIGHRGAAGLAHENTGEAFQAAWDLGVRVLETDVHVSADSVPFCFHDDVLDRVTNLTGRPEDYSWEVLSAAQVVDPTLAGAGTGSGGFAAPPSQATVPPSRLYRIDELLADFPDAHVIIDVKTPDQVAPLARALKAAGAAHRVCVTHAWDSWLEHIRHEVGPELTRCLGWQTLSALVRAVHHGYSLSRIREELSWIRVANYAHIGWRVGPVELMADPNFRQRFTEVAHALGLIVRVWTINQPEQMRALWQDGVDAIFTDRPDLALPTLGL